MFRISLLILLDICIYDCVCVRERESERVSFRTNPPNEKNDEHEVPLQNTRNKAIAVYVTSQYKRSVGRRSVFQSGIEEENVVYLTKNYTFFFLVCALGYITHFCRPKTLG